MPPTPTPINQCYDEVGVRENMVKKVSEQQRRLASTVPKDLSYDDYIKYIRKLGKNLYNKI